MYGFPLLFAKKYKLYICTEANKPYLYNTEINYMSSEVIIDVRKTTIGKLRSIENPDTEATLNMGHIAYLSNNNSD